MLDFKIGDRVLVLRASCRPQLLGLVGTVVIPVQTFAFRDHMGNPVRHAGVGVALPRRPGTIFIATARDVVRLPDLDLEERAA